VAYVAHVGPCKFIYNLRQSEANSQLINIITNTLAGNITAGIKLIRTAVLWAKNCSRNNGMFMNSSVRG
jgi:hypothetical protein